MELKNAKVIMEKVFRFCLFSLFSIALTVTTVFIVKLHSVVPVFPFLILFDVYAALVFLSLFIFTEKMQKYFWETEDYPSYKRILIRQLPLITILTINYIAYWPYFKALWKSFFRNLF